MRNAKLTNFQILENSSSMPLSQGLRCAIALNNMGCLMLEKNCHQQAQETFQDALHLVKELTSFEPGASLSAHVHAAIARSVQSKLHEADIRFSRLEPSSFNVPYDTLSYNVLLPGLQAFLDDRHALRFHPLRIEVNQAEELKMISAEVASCILLLNFAIATAGASRIAGPQSPRTETDPTKDSSRVDNVLRILTLVNLLVEKCDDNSNQSLFLLLHALDTTIRALVEAQKTEEAAELRSRMSTLKSYVQSNLFFLFTREPAARAA